MGSMHWISHTEGGPRRVNHAAVAVGPNKIYTFGGYCTGEDSKAYTSMDVHVLNTNTLRWVRHACSDLPYFENDDILPYKRYGHTAVVHGGSVWLWGGRNDRASCPVLFRFDPEYHSWTAPRTQGQLPAARDGHSACVWRDCMLVYGGYEEDGDEFARTVYSLDLHTLRWTLIHTQGPEPTVRDFHTSIVLHDKMYVFGGRGPHIGYVADMSIREVYFNTIWYLDLHTWTWHRPRVTGDIPIGRRSHSAFVHNEKMYIFGGYNAIAKRHFNDMYEYDPIKSHWTRVTPLGEQPAERRRQACVMVGDRMFLFGGTSPQTPYNEDCTEGDIDKLIDHSDMHVLDFSPSLKTLSLLAVRKYRLDETVLPLNVRQLIQSLVMPNKITICRPTNSAG